MSLNEKHKIADRYGKLVEELINNQSGYEVVDPLTREEEDAVWEEISTEQDLNDIWINISNDLDKTMPAYHGSGIIIKTIAAAIILLIGMVPVRKSISDSIFNQEEIITDKENVEKSETIIIKNKSEVSNIRDRLIVIETPGTINTGPGLIKDGIEGAPDIKGIGEIAEIKPVNIRTKPFSEILEISGLTDSDLVVSNVKTQNVLYGILPVLVPYDPGFLNFQSQADPDSLKINRNYPSKGFSLPFLAAERFSVGMITLLKNTWLLNQETFDGFKYDSYNSTNVVFFPDAGLSLNYSLNRKWSIEADGFFMSKTGQKYREFDNGHYLEKKIVLKYSTLALFVKYNFNKIGYSMHRTSTNVFAGAYWSYLNQASQMTNSIVEDVLPQYRKYDFGLRLGWEINLDILDNLSLSPGLYISFGIPNIYEGTSTIPGSLRITHNGSAEARITFNYHFD